MSVIVVALIVAVLAVIALWFDARVGRRVGWLGIGVLGAALAAAGFTAGWEQGVYGAFVAIVVAIVMVALTLVVYAIASFWRRASSSGNRA
jgi:hypothetical protein